MIPIIPQPEKNFNPAIAVSPPLSPNHADCGARRIAETGDCTTPGHIACYLRVTDGMYFEDKKCKIRIGDETAFAAWCAEGGKGHLAPTGNHLEWERVDAFTHRCTLCGITKEHSNSDGDSFCDICGCEIVNFVRSNTALPIDVQANPFVSMEMGFAPFEYTGEKTVGVTNVSSWRFFNYEGGSIFDVRYFNSTLRYGKTAASKLNLDEKYYVSFGYRNYNGDTYTFFQIEQNGRQKYYQSYRTDFASLHKLSMGMFTSCKAGIKRSVAKWRFKLAYV